MKTTDRILIVTMMLFLMFATPVSSQEDAKRPEYISVTTMHWNMNMKDFKMDEWKAIEKEYLDKVTMKNEYVMGAGFYLHQFTADNTELLYVQTYASWNDIDKAADRNDELAKEAWSDEEARKASRDKRISYYSPLHSDEIYATLPGAKLMTVEPTENMTLYVRKSHFAYPKDGSREEFNALRKEGLEAIIQKNEYIKAYYPSMHSWGHDRTEFIEGFMVDSLADLDKMLDRNSELIKEAFPDENERKKMGKYFTGVHGDYIYSSVAGLNK